MKRQMLVMLTSICMSSFAFADDNEIMDSIVPILGFVAQPKILARHIDVERGQRHIKSSLYVNADGGYKFCSYYVNKTSVSPETASKAFFGGHGKVTIGINKTAINQAIITYEVPCGGGGIEQKTAVDASVTVASFFIFPGPSLLEYVTSLAPQYSIYEAAAGSLSSSVRGSILSKFIKDISHITGTSCGIGDAGSWLKAEIQFATVSEDRACPATPDLWVSM